MRRITGLAMAALLVLVVSACGSDDDTSSSDTTAAPTDDGGDTTTGDDGGDDGSSDDGGSDGDLAAAIAGMGGCSGAAAAVSASISAGLSGQAAEGFEENQALLDDLSSSVPDDLQDAVELYASYMAAYSEALGDFDPSDYSDPEAAAQIGEAFEQLEEDFPSEDLQAASDEISTWFAEECPALEG